MNDSGPVIILAGVQSDGTTYRLHPRSSQRLREAYPTARQAPSVFVGFDTQADFEALHGPVWGQIAMLLTGLTQEQLDACGHVVVRIPATGREFAVEL